MSIISINNIMEMALSVDPLALLGAFAAAIYLLEKFFGTLSFLINSIKRIWRLLGHRWKQPDLTTKVTINSHISDIPIKNSHQVNSKIFGARQSERHPFFISKPLSELISAKKCSRESKRPLFLVIYDDKHPSMSKLYYSLGCFLEYFTTKKLVEDHFVTALIPVSADGARDLVPEDDPLENCLWIVISPEGSILRREGVYANPDEGLKRVREVISATNVTTKNRIADNKIFGARQSRRHPFFISKPLSELKVAKKSSQESKRPLFLVIYDNKHPSMSKLDHSLGCFLEYFTTKKLVEDHFVTALIPVSADGARSLIPKDDPLEKCLWIVISPEGNILRREGVYANPDVGLRKVREVISIL